VLRITDKGRKELALEKITDDAQRPLREGDNQAPRKMVALTTAILELIKAGGHSSTPIGYLQAFFLVALEPGLSVKEYANRLKVLHRTMRRYPLDIGDRNRQEAPALRLATSRPNLFKYELTAKAISWRIKSRQRCGKYDKTQPPAVKREAEEDWGRR
jgi:hypothetical protein